MIEREYQKECNLDKLNIEIITAGLPVDPNPGARFYGCTARQYPTYWLTKVLLYDNITQNEIATIDAIVAAHIPTLISQTKISKKADSTVSGTADNNWIIPTGRVLQLQRLKVSSASSASSKVTLYYDPTGDGNNMTTIMTVYTMGTTTNVDISNEDPILGDGTKRIKMRRIVASGSNDIYSSWEGTY